MYESMRDILHIIAEGQAVCGKLERRQETHLRGACRLKDCNVTKSERLETREASLLLPPPAPMVAPPAPLPPCVSQVLKASHQAWLQQLLPLNHLTRGADLRVSDN